MALTREERQAIETLIKKVRSLENKVNTLERSTNAMQKMLDGISSQSNILDWSGDQIAKWLKQYISNIGTNGLQMHDHTNDQRGGNCFAKLGANLIE